MVYESAKTPKGNVGVSCESQEAADFQATRMDENGNVNCSNCSNCRNCHDCRSCSNCRNCHDCRNCRNCSNCSNCRNCFDCRDCRNCSNCSNCRNCFDCRDCFDCSDTQGALRWDGEQTKNLLSINGLCWPVSTDGKSIQIGCQHHSVEDWQNFDDCAIARMDSEALEFWLKHKGMVMALARARAEMGEA